MLRLAIALFLAQTGFHAYVASLPLALLAADRSDALIGALMGAAAVVQIPAGFLAGGLIDRFGGRAIFLASAAAFLLAALLLVSGLAAPGGALPALVAVRLLQGVGLAACMPAALSLVPGLVGPARLATGLSLVALAGNVSLAVSPPVSLAILGAGSLQLVSTVVLATVAGSLGLGWTLERGGGPEGPTGRPEARRPRGRLLRPAWRPSWGPILLAMVLYLVHWGVVTGYLPQRAAAAGADVGLLFTADALSLVVLRLPAAWLTDRLGSHGLILAGFAVTIGALVVLLLPPTTPLMILAGLGTGSGAALVLPPVTLELSRRSDASDRGSAFALYSVAFAVGIALGSEAFAPFIDTVGFDVAASIGIAALVAAIATALVDRRLWARRPAPATA